jgi:hypothetical protein
MLRTRLAVPLVLTLSAGSCFAQGVPVQFYMWGEHDPMAASCGPDKSSVVFVFHLIGGGRCVA